MDFMNHAKSPLDGHRAESTTAYRVVVNQSSVDMQFSSMTLAIMWAELFVAPYGRDYDVVPCKMH
jgi:hypothetical protein